MSDRRVTVQAVDLMPPPVVFGVKIFINGEERESREIDSTYSDTAIRMIVANWSKKYAISPNEQEVLVEEIKGMRKSRQPK